MHVSFFLTLVLCHLSYLIGAQNSSCPVGAIQSTLDTSICYLYVDQNKDANTSEAYCASIGGHSTSILNVYENKFIVDYLNKVVKHPDLLVWTGGYAQYIGNVQPFYQWGWKDGSEFKYDNFDANYDGSAYGGLYIGFRPSTGTWVSDFDYAFHTFLCKLPIENA